MIGKLVAIRVEAIGTMLEVTGLIAQPKNRKAAWSFLVPQGQRELCVEKVEECEETRKSLDTP